MKKLLLIAMVAFGFAANAQEVHFGAKGGLNLSSLDYKIQNPQDGKSTGLDSRFNFHLGLMAEIVISDKFSVQPELLYSRQGGVKDFSGEALGSAFKFDNTFALDYLSLPIMAKYYVAEGFSLEAGPQIGFLLSSKLKSEGEATIAGKTTSKDSSKDFKEFMSSVDFGLGFGAGYKLENGLNFGVRYNLGLTDVFKENKGDAIKNGVFQLSVGYFF